MARRSLGSLTLDIIAKFGGFKQGMDQAARIADDRSRRINRAMRGLSGAISNVFAGVGFGLLVRGIVRATDEQEKALANLEQALISTGGAVGFTSKQLQGFADDIQKTTRFSDEAVQGLQARLLAFTNITGPEFERLTELTLDYATATGKDAAEAAQAFGLALNNPATGMARLKRAGVDLDDSTKKLIKSLAESGKVTEAQNLLMDELARLYGGRAAAAADTFGGALEQVKNAFGELLEAPGGMEDAKQSLQEFRDLLQDPQTLQAAATLTGGIVKLFSAATSAIFDMANAFKFLGEELAAGISGPAFDDLVRLDERLVRLKELRDSPIKLLLLPVDARQVDEAIRKTEILILRSQQAQKAARPTPASAGTPGTGTGATATAIQSAEFLKLEKSLKEQIELYGSVGKAAEIAYQIQSGALDEISDAEQKQLLALARQYDAKVRSAEASKVLAAEEKKLDDSYKSQLAALEDQLRLTGAITEADKVRIATTIGELKKLNDIDKEHLITVAVQVDQKNAEAELRDINLQILELRGNTAEAIKVRFEIEHAEQAERFRQTADPADDRALATLRELTIAQAEYNRLQQEASKILDDLALQEERIRNSQEVGALTEIEAMRKIGEAREKAVEQLDGVRAALEAVAAATNSEEMTAGVERLRVELEKLRGETDLLAQQINSNIKESFTTAFADIAKATKSVSDAFGDMVKDIQNMLLDLIAQNLVEQLFKGMGGGPGGGIGGFLGGLFGGGFEKGGYLQPGKFGIAGEKGHELIYGGRAGLTVVKHDETIEVLRQLQAAHQLANLPDIRVAVGVPELIYPFPSRDMGGRGYPGQPYSIGTGAQPELFVPDSAGRFIPNDKAGGTTIINQNFTVQAPNGTTSRATQQQIATAAGRGIRDAVGRNT